MELLSSADAKLAKMENATTSCVRNCKMASHIKQAASVRYPQAASWL